MPSDHYDRIRVVLVYKFPNYEDHICQGALPYAKREQEGRTERNEIVAYFHELRGKSRDELDRLATKARAAIRLMAMHERELARVVPDLDSKYLAADYDHWALFSTWTTEEAAALALGADPRRCDRDRMLAVADEYPFAAKYIALCDLIERAQSDGILKERIIPADFLAFAAERRLELSQHLTDAVKMAPPYRPNASDRIAELERQVEKQNAAAAPTSSFRSRTLAQVVLGVSVAKYNHQPEKARNPTAKRISDDCTSAGYRVCEDSVRSLLEHLTEFAERG
jgi:hypothetical protein